MHHRFWEWDDADRTYLAEDRYKWRASVNTEMYIFFQSRNTHLDIRYFYLPTGALLCSLCSEYSATHIHQQGPNNICGHTT